MDPKGGGVGTEVGVSGRGVVNYVPVSAYVGVAVYRWVGVLGSIGRVSEKFPLGLRQCHGARRGWEM